MHSSKAKRYRQICEGFLLNDTKIDRQLKTLLEYIEKRRIPVPNKIKEYLSRDEAEREQHAQHAYEIAQRRVKQNRYKEAIVDYGEAIRHKSDYFKAYRDRGRAKVELGYYTAAIYDYDKALSIKPDNVAVYIWRGIAKRNIENYNGAIADYDMVIKLSSNPEFGYHYRGFIKSCMGEYEAAIDDYNQSIEHKDDEAKVYWHRGLAKLKIEKYHEAVDDFLCAIYDYDMENATATHYRLMADAYTGAGYSDAAISCLDDAIELKDDDPSLYKYRAELYEALRQHEDAIDDYDDAIRLKSDDAHTILARGLVKYELERENEAFTDFDTAFGIKPDLCSEECIDKSILNAYTDWKNLLSKWTSAEQHPLNQLAMEWLRQLNGLEEEDPDPPLETGLPILDLHQWADPMRGESEPLIQLNELANIDPIQVTLALTGSPFPDEVLLMEPSYSLKEESLKRQEEIKQALRRDLRMELESNMVKRIAAKVKL